MHGHKDIHSGPAPVNVIGALGGLAQRKTLIAALTLIGLLAGLYLSRIMQPVFVAEARIAIEAAETPAATASEMSILSSRDLGLQVAVALQLDKRAGFAAGSARMGWLGNMLAKMGLAGGARPMTPEQQAMARYLNGLTVYRVPGSDVMAVSFADGDAATAAEVANTLAEIYVNKTREAVPPRPVVVQRQSLAPQIEEMRRNVAAAEQAVAAYRKRPRLSQPPAAMPPVEEISGLVARIAIAEAARDEAEAKARAARAFLAASDPADASTDAFDSLSIQRLKEDHAAAELRVAGLSVTYLPNHPKLIAAQKELADIGRKLRREVAAVAAGLEEQAKAALAREAALRQSLAALKPMPREDTAALNEAELDALVRQAAAGRAMLENLLARDADMPAPQQAPARPSTARIIQTATAPAAPVSPRPGPLAAIGALAGFLLGLSTALVASVLGGSAAPDDPPLAATPPVIVRPPVEKAPPLPPPPIEVAVSAPPPEAAPVAGTRYSDPAPEPRQHEPAPRVSEPGSAMTLNPLAAMPSRLSVAEVTDSLSGGQMEPTRRLADAAALMAFWAADAHRVSASRRFGIMSFGCSVGDTSAATVAMARALTRANKKTVIVDLCRAGSWLEALLGTAAGPGIADLVSGAAEFTKVMARDTRSPVHLLRYGQDRSEWARGLVEQHIESVLQALENAYDILIVHAGEVVTDTPGLMRRCHAALVLAPPTHCNDAAVAIGALSTAALRDVQYVLIEERAARAVQAA